jgi:hypothetical protein
MFSTSDRRFNSSTCFTQISTRAGHFALVPDMSRQIISWLMDLPPSNLPNSYRLGMRGTGSAASSVGLATNN